MYIFQVCRVPKLLLLRFIIGKHRIPNPETIANINVGSISGAGNRHGDNASYNIDENGNGFIFFGDNAATDFLRIPVSGYKTVDATAIKVLPSKSDATMGDQCI